MKKKILTFIGIGAVTITTLAGCGTKSNDIGASSSNNEEVSQDSVNNEDIVNDIVSDMENIVENLEDGAEIVTEIVTEQVQKQLSDEDKLEEIASTFYEDCYISLDDDFDEYQGKMVKAYDINEELVLCEDGLADGVTFYTFNTPIEDVIFHQANSSDFILCKLKDGTIGVFAQGSNSNCVLIEGVDTEGAICVNNYNGLRIIYDDYTCSYYKLSYHHDEDGALESVTVDYIVDERVPFTIFDRLSDESPDETLAAVRNDFKKMVIPTSNEEYMMVQFSDNSVLIMGAGFGMSDGHNFQTNEEWAYTHTDCKYMEDLEFPVEMVISNDSYQIMYQTTGDDKKAIFKGYDRTLIINLPENYTTADIVFTTGGDDGIVVEFSDQSIWTTRDVEDITDTNTFDMEKEAFLSQLNQEGKLHSYTSHNGQYFTFLCDGFMYTYSVH